MAKDNMRVSLAVMFVAMGVFEKTAMAIQPSAHSPCPSSRVFIGHHQYYISEGVKLKIHPKTLTFTEYGLLYSDRQKFYYIHSNISVQFQSVKQSYLMVKDKYNNTFSSNKYKDQKIRIIFHGDSTPEYIYLNHFGFHFLFIDRSNEIIFVFTKIITNTGWTGKLSAIPINNISKDKMPLPVSINKLKNKILSVAVDKSTGNLAFTEKLAQSNWTLKYLVKIDTSNITCFPDPCEPYNSEGKTCDQINTILKNYNSAKENIKICNKQVEGVYTALDGTLEYIKKNTQVWSSIPGVEPNNIVDTLKSQYTCSFKKQLQQHENEWQELVNTTIEAMNFAFEIVNRNKSVEVQYPDYDQTFTGRPVIHGRFSDDYMDVIDVEDEFPSQAVSPNF